MYCRFCGTKIPDNVKFCPECGANLAPVPSAAPEESAPAAPAAPEIPTPFDPTPFDPAPYSADSFASADVAAAPQRGMKWFKFIIYFQLWAGMLVNLAAAAKYFTGAYYEGNAGMVYDFFPALQPLDIVMGVFCLALAVYAVVVQRALAKFRAKGPMVLSDIHRQHGRHRALSAHRKHHSRPVGFYRRNRRKLRRYARHAFHQHSLLQQPQAPFCESVTAFPREVFPL